MLLWYLTFRTSMLTIQIPPVSLCLWRYSRTWPFLDLSLCLKTWPIKATRSPVSLSVSQIMKHPTKRSFCREKVRYETTSAVRKELHYSAPSFIYATESQNDHILSPSLQCIFFCSTGGRSTRFSYFLKYR